MNFSQKDLETIEQHQLTEQEIIRQINILKSGLPATEVIEPAVVNNGIIKLDDKQINVFLELFKKNKEDFSIEKFVPASGAATRMFKEWIFFHQNYKPGKDYYERFVRKNNLKTFETELEDFLDNLSAYAFYEELMTILLQQEPGFHQLDENHQVWTAIHYILSDEGLGYQKHPKAFISFHRYKNGVTKTAMEEHFVEAVEYAKGKTEFARLHFTISPQHEIQFKDLSTDLTKKYNVQVSYSFQKPSTDTVMVYKNNEIVRDETGKIVFRPGGHGALIENIQDLEADIILIKNIDNVQKGEKQSETLLYKKILAGFLIDLLQKNKKFLTKLKNEKPIQEELKEIENFAKNQMNIRFIDGYDMLNNSGKRKYLFYKLNRPIRVAGMVKNTGEPGGGPFWALDKNEIKSLQIVEKAQIDTNVENQKNILEKSTHFNPVDLVISIFDFEGNKFNLQEFINDKAAFLTEKSYQGKPVKVYERPGLWNGAMDGWNTVFIEVPLETFSPVKVIQDLLKSAHQ